MYRLKKTRHSPRTLYNGPFVVPNQTSQQKTNRNSSPSFVTAPSSLFSHWTEHPWDHSNHGYFHHSPATPWSKPELRPFLHRNEISTSRSDEGCRPVYNLSFLDDSGAGINSSTHHYGYIQPNSPQGFHLSKNSLSDPLEHEAMNDPTISSPSTTYVSSGGYKLQSPGIGKSSRSGPSMTPRMNKVPTPRLNRLLFSNVNPSLGLGTNNNSKSNELQLLKHLSNLENRVGVSPRFIKRPSLLHTNYGQRQSSYSPSRIQKCSSSSMSGLGGFQNAFYSRDCIVYCSEPQTSDGNLTNLKALDNQENLRPSPQDAFTMLRYFHQCSPVHLHKMSHVVRNASHTCKSQHLQPFNSHVHYYHFASNQNKDNAHAESLRRRQTEITEHLKIQQNAYHVNVDDMSFRKHQEHTVALDFETRSKYPYQHYEDSSCTRHSSYNSILSSDQSTRTVNNIQKNCKISKIREFHTKQEEKSCSFPVDAQEAMHDYPYLAKIHNAPTNNLAIAECVSRVLSTQNDDFKEIQHGFSYARKANRPIQKEDAWDKICDKIVVQAGDFAVQCHERYQNGSHEATDSKLYWEKGKCYGFNYFIKDLIGCRVRLLCKIITIKIFIIF